MAAEETARYWAFISYSHQDERWGRWLHRALETYRVPRRLVGKETPVGKIPKRLLPIFRDREEMPSSAALAATINEALTQSRFQIVICSPHSASSRWVNEEIKTFKRLGREQRVLALIVDGAPNASETAGSGLPECFPRALRRQLDASGEIGEEKAEVVAADARKGKDGLDNAKLKIIAGLLGVGLDELKQRERARLRVQWALRIASVLAMVAAIATFVRVGEETRAEQAHLQHLETLVDLGRKELVNNESARAATYLSDAYSSGARSTDVQFLLSRTLPAVEAMTEKAFALSRAHYSNQLSLSPDGQSFLSIEESENSQDNLGKLTRLSDGSTIALLVDTAGAPFTRFSTDGKKVLLAGRASLQRGDAITQVYDLESGKRLLAAPGAADVWLGNGWPMLATSAGDPQLHRVLTLGANHRALVWDIDTGKPVRTLPSKANTVSAAFSKDGAQIVTGESDGTVEVWDAATGKAILQIHAKPARPTAAMFLARLVVTFGDSGALNLWDRRSGDWEGVLSGHGQKVIQALPSSNDHWLLTGAEGEPARVWEVSMQRSVFALPEKFDAYAYFDMSDDARELLRRADDRHVAIVYSTHAASLPLFLDGHVGPVTSTVMSTDGSRALTAGYDGLIREWDLRDLKFTPMEFLHHGARIDKTASTGVFWSGFGTDGKIISVGSDGAARIWGDSQDAPAKILTGHTAPIQAAAIGGASDSRLITGSVDGTARIWDLASGSTISTLAGAHQHPVERVALSADGKLAATMDFTDPIAHLWDARAGKELVTLKGHAAPLRSIRFTADGEKVVTASADKSAKVWDSNSGRMLFSLEGHTDALWSAVPSPDDATIVTVSADRSARLWSATDGKLLRILNADDAGPLESATFTHDSKRIAIGADNGMVLIWDLRTGNVRKLTGLEAGFSDSVTFSPGESLVASPSLASGEFGIWGVESGRLLMKWKDPTHFFYTVAFSPDGNRLVAAGPTKGEVADFPVFDVSLETRTPEQIAAVIRCKSPWKVDGERLLPHAPEAPNCPGLVEAHH